MIIIHDSGSKHNDGIIGYVYSKAVYIVILVATSCDH